METSESFVQLWRVGTLPFGRGLEGRGPGRHGHQPAPGVELGVAFGPRDAFHWKVKVHGGQQDFTLLCVANKAVDCKGRAGAIGRGETLK